MRIVVIGAGVGGMSAALRLAHDGHEVTVVEQGDHIGGKLNIWEPDVPGIGRFRFDTGPHVLTMPWAIRGLFESVGERMEDWLDLVRMDPICRYHFIDAPFFDARADIEQAARQVSAHFPGNEEGFLRFLDYAHQVHDVTVEPFLCQDFGAAVRGIPTIEQWRQLGAFLRLKPWKSLRSRVREHFRDPRLRRVFELYAEYSGSLPDKASGIFSIIAWEQWGDGTWYLRGGLYTFAKALEAIAQKMGLSVRLNTPVSGLEINGPSGKGKVSAVHLQDGSRLPVDAVVCNADPLTAYTTLIPETHRRPPYDAKGIGKMEPSSSAFVMLLGVRGAPEEVFPHLAHFNSFVGQPKSAVRGPDGSYRKGSPREYENIGVTCQSITEPEVAPPGYSALFVMISRKALGSSLYENWSAKSTKEHREYFLDDLTMRCGMPELRERIVCEQIWTPRTFAEKYGAWRGSLYGVSSNGLRQAFLRPPIRAKGISGLYFAGGGTHPGGGLPLVTLSGKIAAEAVLNDDSGGER